MGKDIILAYDGKCIVCREIARNLSLELNARYIPVQNLYSRYGLAHDAYLIIDSGIFIRGYGWIIPYIYKKGFKKIFLRLIISGYGIKMKYRLIKGYGGHPLKFLGHGKILLKLLSLLVSLIFLDPLYRVWRWIWASSL